MPSAERTEVFDIDAGAFYATIIDYKAYPEFVPQLRQVRVLKSGEDEVRAKFTAHMLRDVTYTLDLRHNPGKSVEWELVRSDIFTRMDGSWTLRRKGKHKTEVTYWVDVESRIAAPSALVRYLVASGLPRMMKSFYRRARDLGEE